MKSLVFKPESFTYYSSSQTFYVNGVVVESLIDKDSVIIRRGSNVQLVFTSSVPNFEDSRSKLFSGEKFSVFIEPYAREAKLRNRAVRLQVIRFDADDIWRDI